MPGRRSPDPQILALTDRIDYVVDESLPGPEQFKGVVRIELTDGTVLEEIEEHNRGSLLNPMTLDEIGGKFRENVADVLTTGDADRIIETILKLDRLDDAKALTKFTVPNG